MRDQWVHARDLGPIELPSGSNRLGLGGDEMARDAAHLCDAPFLNKPYSYEALRIISNGCWRDLRGAAAKLPRSSSPNEKSTRA